jgi:hypothetical protein
VTLVVAAPYVRFASRFTIGPWEFIPHRELTVDDTPSQMDFDRAKGLMALYHRSRRVREDFGCYVSRRRGLLGDPVPFAQLGLLRTVALFGFLDRNPVALELGGDDDANAGHRTWTSDNLFIAGHNVDPAGYVAARYGAMSQNLIAGLNIDDEHSEISPPAELVCPLMGSGADAVVTDALWTVLRQSTPEARRIRRAIDWLDLAWRNTPSVSQEMRIVLLKSGFETLLDVGDRVVDQRAALQALLPRVAPRRRLRQVPTLAGQLRAERMSDLEWWYTNLAFLRNAITHGDVITGGMHRFGRTYHLWIAELRLRQVIKECVAQRGFPLVPM